MTDLRAGLVGLGAMGRNHARILKHLPGVKLVAVADPAGDPTGAASGAALVGTLDELLEHSLDYVVVAAPTATHLDIAKNLAHAGVHALVEKPLTTRVDNALELAQEFSDAGLIGAVGHIERYNPALQQAKRRLADGLLGDVYQIVTRRQGPFPGRISDVGVILDLATHDFDLTAWIADSPYTTVFASTTHRSGRQHEDLVAAVGALASGTITNHLVNWLSPLKERVTVITGEKGALVADTLSADLTYYENGVVPSEWSEIARFRGVTEGDSVRYAFPKPEPLRVEHETFRDAVLGKPADIVTFDQAVRVVAVAEACSRSAAEGSVQRVAQS